MLLGGENAVVCGGGRVSLAVRAPGRLDDLARLRRVRIDREYARPLDVEALARGVHMSAGHLSRRFCIQEVIPR